MFREGSRAKDLLPLATLGIKSCLYITLPIWNREYTHPPFAILVLPLPMPALAHYPRAGYACGQPSICQTHPLQAGTVYSVRSDRRSVSHAGGYRQLPHCAFWHY